MTGTATLAATHHLKSCRYNAWAFAATTCLRDTKGCTSDGLAPERLGQIWNPKIKRFDPSR